MKATPTASSKEIAVAVANCIAIGVDAAVTALTSTVVAVESTKVAKASPFIVRSSVRVPAAASTTTEP